MPHGAARGFALLAVVLALASCTGKAGNRSAAAASEARIQRTEQRDVDALLARLPSARIVDSYHIDFEVLTVLVAAPEWKRLGTGGQNDFKRSVWRGWRDVYVRRHPGTHDRIFVKVEDLQGNDLGSYFE